MSLFFTQYLPKELGISGFFAINLSKFAGIIAGFFIGFFGSCFVVFQSVEARSFRNTFVLSGSQPEVLPFWKQALLVVLFGACVRVLFLMITLTIFGDAVHYATIDNLLASGEFSKIDRIVNLLTLPVISDTQCGFKLFDHIAARQLFEMATEKVWAFDIEILFLAQKFGMHISQEPVVWEAKEGSKLHFVSDSLKMPSAILRIRHKRSGI